MTWFLAILFIFTAAASEVNQQRILGIQNLRTGNILLIPIQCQLCKLIEGEESTPYSHAGLVVKERGATFILEAWTKTQKVPAEEFISRIPKRKAGLVLQTNVAISSQRALKLFKKNFEGLPYDSYFLWDNLDKEKNQPLYCTEFLYKFLQYFSVALPQPKPMHYQFHRQEWQRYFYKLDPPANPPDGLPGLSPGDFERFEGFKKKGIIPSPKN